MKNKNEKEFAKYALEETRQKQVEDKKVRAASARRERASSKIRVREELQRVRSTDAAQTKELMNRKRA